MSIVGVHRPRSGVSKVRRRHEVCLRAHNVLDRLGVVVRQKRIQDAQLGISAERRKPAHGRASKPAHGRLSIVG
jgi:hypothetical protein